MISISAMLASLVMMSAPPVDGEVSLEDYEHVEQLISEVPDEYLLEVSQEIASIMDNNMMSRSEMMALEMMIEEIQTKVNHQI